MDENEKRSREQILKQLIAAHGRVEYTYTAHHKIADRLIFVDEAIRVTQIILTTVSTAGFLATIISNQVALSWVGGGFAALSLALNLYSKDFRLQAEARTHKDAADLLWDIRENYKSLITDSPLMRIEEIRSRRDYLQECVSAVNKKYPGTDKRGYKNAKKSLEEDEEQTFKDGEAEKFLF